MICIQCNEIMVTISSSQGQYFNCKKCNNVSFPLSTYKKQDIVYSEEELDMVVIRGRD
jgi:DNA-directed RNA polymerase subunit M/transcription elongation factor TFIIS